MFWRAAQKQPTVLIRILQPKADGKGHIGVVEKLQAIEERGGRLRICKKSYAKQVARNVIENPFNVDVHYF